jgi:hypothetical protein
MTMKGNLSAVIAFLLISSAMPLPAAGLEAYTFETCHLQGACRLLSQAELDRLRGGFTAMGPNGPINITFGISQVVYINNQLVASTQLVLPDIAQAFNNGGFSAAQIKALTDSLNSGAVTTAAAHAAASAANAAVAGNSQNQPTTGTTSTSPAQSASSSAPTTSVANPLPTASMVPVVRVNGVPITPGSVVNAGAAGALVVQNGPGNISVIPTAQNLQAATNALVIQNTLNNQTISAMTTLNISLTLTPALNAANIQQMVRQSMANSLR